MKKECVFCGMRVGHDLRYLPSSERGRQKYGSKFTRLRRRGGAVVVVVVGNEGQMQRKWCMLRGCDWFSVQIHLEGKSLRGGRAAALTINLNWKCWCQIQRTEVDRSLSSY
jgi:hypothetical protein